ncbi:MAG: FtsX-like permease family protein [Lentisphaerae bacterium]|jgi:putative ABC transport system permease protein|nr:FtsX-like permease family protein [Lentisphaerota bacterium]
MKFSATWMIALRALRRNPMRTGLTMLGIIIGVAAVIAMVAIGSGAKAEVAASIEQMGQNMVMIISRAARSGRVHMGGDSGVALTKQDYDAIRQEVCGLAGATPEVRANAQVAYGNENVNTTIYGVSEEYPAVRAWRLERGEHFTGLDIRRATKVAVLGQTVAANLFDGGDPVGQMIRIQHAPYEVIGVLRPKGANMMGRDQDDLVLVPWTSAMVRLTGETTFRSISVQAESAERIPEVVEQITELLRQRHRIPEGRDDDFMIRNMQDMLEVATSTAQTMTVLLGAIAGVSLLVGGIGIMNIMLVSVTERTREIGVRLAVGARGADILLQFLVEAMVLSISGGVLGIALGYAVAHLVSVRFGWITLVSLDSVALAFVFSGAIGIFFGFYPARKAAGLDPIEALRYE